MRIHDFSKGRKCSACGMDSADSMGSECRPLPTYDEKARNAYTLVLEHWHNDGAICYNAIVFDGSEAVAESGPMWEVEDAMQQAGLKLAVRRPWERRK